MKSLLLSLAAACLFLMHSPMFATTFSTLEAVDNDGASTYAGGPTTLTGVVINNPYDMLSGTSEWQVFIQTLDHLDHGGAALYMIKSFTWGPPAIYTDAEWTSEKNRLMYSGTDGKALSYGDVITVTTDVGGLEYMGKFNINEQHKTDSAYDFNITVNARGTTPVAANIALSNLKNPGNTFIFDQTRATGCEHYQGSLVHLDNLLLSSASVSSWTNDGIVSVKQGNLTFDMQLGLDTALASIDASKLTTTPFSVTAILDQESSDYTSGYRLWLTNASMLTVPEPGTIALLVAGLIGLAAYALRKRA